MRKIKLIILCSLLLCLCNKIIAQQICTDDNVQALPGKWKIAMAGEVSHSVSDVAKERPLLKAIVQNIRDNFKWQPLGGDISFNDRIFFSFRACNNPMPLGKTINAYGANIFFQHFFCNAGKTNLEDFHAILEVNINQLPFKYDGSYFHKDPTKRNEYQEDPETNVYFISSILPVIKNGVWDFYISNRGGNRNTTYDSTLKDQVAEKYRLLCKEDIDPIVPVTKKEFYNNWLNYHKLDLIAADETIKYYLSLTDPNLTVEWKQTQVKSEEQIKTTINNYIRAIEEILKTKSEKELSTPAFLEEKFGKYITKPDGPIWYYQYILKPNPAYFNSKLPKSVPQLVVIHLCGYDDYLKGNRVYPTSLPDKNFVYELIRMNVFDLLTQQLKPLIQK